MDEAKNAVEVFDKCANIYQERFMDVSLYANALDLFCNAITKEDAEILEIACGPGNITKYLLQRRPGFRILGIDLAPNMIALAKINNPQAEFQVMDCRDIDAINKKYDGIVCGFCLPYLPEEEASKLIGDAAKLLRQGGVFYLSTMEEDDHNKSGLKTASTGDQIYVYYHRADHLTDALTKNGFDVISHQYLEYSENNGTKTTDLVMIAKLS